MIEIKDAQISDYLTIANFQKLMAFETENLELDENTIKKGVKAIFENPEKGKYYIAINESNEIIACLMTTFEWSDWRNSTMLWIQSVYVVPEYRKHGVFRRMYEHVKKNVETNKQYSGIRLYVDKTNQKAQKAYNAVGMNGEHYTLFEWMK